MSGPAVVGALLGGRYRLRFHIASGAMAEVWCADDEVLGRPVAVKILHGHVAADPAMRARFHTEAVAAARLVHPSIVAIFDTCEVGSSEAIVMELVRGRTLRDYLDERGRLEPIEIVHIGAEVASALSCAHHAGIIHRDIKPANILLSDDGRVLVTDFGIAKVLDEPDLTRTNQLIGTVKYLAPEQVRGTAIDARTDLYSLGAVLYEALCGSPPFVGENSAAVALARLQRDPLPASLTIDDLPEGMDATISRCLARPPDDRYSSADDLRAALLAIRLDSRVSDQTVTMTIPRPDPEPVDSPGNPAVSLIGSDSGGRSSRSMVLVSLIVVTALVLIALLVSSTDVGHTLFATDPTTSTTAPPASLALGGVRSFDPMGAGEPTENEPEAPNAIDGDALTSWRTEEYTTRTFGNLKSGVGLVVDLSGPHRLGHITITSPTVGWAVEIHAINGQVPDSLSGWGTAIASAANIQGDVVLSLQDATASSILLWITDLGEANPPKVKITEVGLSSD